MIRKGCLIFFLLFCIVPGSFLLRDVTSITLRRGDHTAGRRSSPVPQLQCVGGTAKGVFSPKVVQCYNRGFDGLDVQWECQAEMPREFQFGKGFDHPNDPFILAGSCGLDYELDYSRAGASKGIQSGISTKYGDGDYTLYMVYLFIVCFVLYLIYLSLTGPRDGGEGDRGGRYPGGGPGGPGGPDPPGWRRPSAPPPSYDDATKSSGPYTSSTSGANGPGFWSGMGLGALGGYLAGNVFQGPSNTAYRRRNPTQFDRDTGYYDNPSSSNYQEPSSSGFGSSDTHTTSGFGGTTRR